MRIAALTFSFIFSLLLWSCNSPSSDGQAGTADSTEESAEASSGEEAEEESEEKSSRPSPPRTATGQIGGAEITINYSSPSVKGREIWGELVPYGKVWRTGANEATTISFSKAVSVEGKTLAAGKYALFTIPGEEEWVVIFNTVPNQWGAYEYDEAKDALRARVAPEKLDEKVEALEFVVGEGQVALRWDQLAVPLSVEEAPGKE